MSRYSGHENSDDPNPAPKNFRIPKKKKNPKKLLVSHLEREIF